jgi:hypothetical protein
MLTFLQSPAPLLTTPESIWVALGALVALSVAIGTTVSRAFISGARWSKVETTQLQVVNTLAALEKRVSTIMDSIMQIMQDHEKRIITMETVCRMNHPGSEHHHQ